jgi:hypothetical protein
VFLLFCCLFLCWHLYPPERFSLVTERSLPTILLSAASLISEFAMCHCHCQHISCILNELLTGNIAREESRPK